MRLRRASRAHDEFRPGRSPGQASPAIHRPVGASAKQAQRPETVLVHALAERTERRHPGPSSRQENVRGLLEAAKSIFAEHGFAGATTAAIARRAGVPKANLHYYFPTKEALYRAVVERALAAWLKAASAFEVSGDPAHALSAYIRAEMDLARSMPLGSRIRLAEVMRGAPMIQDFLDTTLAEWVASRETAVRRWIAAGQLKPIEPKVLFHMIWATTRHYATAAREIETLNGGRPLDDGAFERAKAQVVATILGGVKPQASCPQPRMAF